jgi:hypothetical protein
VRFSLEIGKPALVRAEVNLLIDLLQVMLLACVIRTTGCEVEEIIRHLILTHGRRNVCRGHTAIEHEGPAMILSRAYYGFHAELLVKEVMETVTMGANFAPLSQCALYLSRDFLRR